MSFARRYIAELKRQSSAKSESWAIRNVRRQLAALSCLFGLLGGTYPLNNPLQGWLIPGWVLFVIGGAAGVAVWIIRDPFRSRRWGLVAFVSTALGIAFFVIGR